MTVYLDTSVILRILFREGNPGFRLEKMGQSIQQRFVAREALRITDRLRLTQEITDIEVAALVREIQVIDDTLAICAIDETILQRAGETFPTVVGTLDAIHLASALRIREIDALDALLTLRPSAHHSSEKPWIHCHWRCVNRIAAMTVPS